MTDTQDKLPNPFDPASFRTPPDYRKTGQPSVRT